MKTSKLHMQSRAGEGEADPRNTVVSHLNDHKTRTNFQRGIYVILVTDYMTREWLPHVSL